jgi:hypothetical protein
MTSLACRFFLQQRGDQCRLVESNERVMYGFDNVRVMLMDMVQITIFRNVPFFNFGLERCEFSAIKNWRINFNDLGQGS